MPPPVHAVSAGARAARSIISFFFALIYLVASKANYEIATSPSRTGPGGSSQ